MKKNDCIFCKIANGELSSETIYEDKDLRVILDLSPAARGHALIIPKEHFDDLCDMDETISAKILPLSGRVGSAMKQTLGCPGFNVVQNNGREAGQTVFHFHTHVIPRYLDGPAMITWEPGEANREELANIGTAIRSAL